MYYETCNYTNLRNNWRKSLIYVLQKIYILTMRKVLARNMSFCFRLSDLLFLYTKQYINNYKYSTIYIHIRDELLRISLYTAFAIHTYYTLIPYRTTLIFALQANSTRVFRDDLPPSKVNPVIFYVFNNLASTLSF